VILICANVFDFLQIKVSSGRTLLLKETLAPSTVPEKTGIVRAPKREHEAVKYFYLEICQQQVVNQCLRIPSILTSVHFSIQVIGDTWKRLQVEAEDEDEDKDKVNKVLILIGCLMHQSICQSETILSFARSANDHVFLSKLIGK